MKLRKRHRDRKGAAVVEFAICAPLLLLIGFGFINAGLLVQLRHNSKMIGHLAATDLFIAPQRNAVTIALIQQKYQDLAEQLGISNFEITITEQDDIAQITTSLPVPENSPIPTTFQTSETIATDTFVYAPIVLGGQP